MLFPKDYKTFEALSPFEIKNELISLAQADKSAHAYLNAGRGNPNWIATRAREAFFLLGFFALSESRRTFEDDEAGLAGMPAEQGSYQRLKRWLKARRDDDATPGADTLGAAVDYAIEQFGFTPDRFVHELTDSIIGDNYPVPDRCLEHTEVIAHAYLRWALCAGHDTDAHFDLFPVEGGTAAMCYVFKALKNARLLNPGDTIAICTPVFTPYLEMPGLEDYELQQVHVPTLQENHFQLTDESVAVLEDKRVKAFFLVNPGNPSSVALNEESIRKLVTLVQTKRPDLIILTDDVYGTFVPGFQSLIGHLPRNTIGVYSYSKYFGATGWRLGVIALAQDNILDEAIARQPERVKLALDARYVTLSLTPRSLKFIDRIVADSRDVALNHTAGLSLPQQVMLSLFSLVELMDTQKIYQKACCNILERRFRKLIQGMGLQMEVSPQFDRYYGLIDFEFWLRQMLDDDIVQWIKQNVHPLDITFKLAQQHGVVMLNGSGFDAPGWSARVSFANLEDDAYERIGHAVRAVAGGYVQAYRAAKGLPL